MTFFYLGSFLRRARDRVTVTNTRGPVNLYHGRVESYARARFFGHSKKCTNEIKGMVYSLEGGLFCMSSGTTSCPRGLLSLGLGSCVLMKGWELADGGRIYEQEESEIMS